MKACDVQQMLNNSYEDPCFFVNFHNIGRGILGDTNTKSHIGSTTTLNCWRILDDQLEKVENDMIGILFDTETYIFQWTFQYVTDSTSSEDTLFYYWKGLYAAKGYSPLPPEIENQNPVVERICQWSEPALFFHMFPKYLCVFSGAYEKFDMAKRLFIIRGEIQSEIHLYEVPCTQESLRSKGVFILVDPEEGTLYRWFGSAVSCEYEELIRNSINLDKICKYYENYKVIEIKSGHDDLLLNKFDTETDDSFIKCSLPVGFTPRLFYFNSMTGDFLATEVEYPLRYKKHYAAFPFLQSHLYTADQPALFLLDNDKEIWLWEGWKTPESNMELFKIELGVAKKTVDSYAQEKDHAISIPIKHVLAGLEPLEFTNLFPYWTKRCDITDLQLKYKQ